MSKGNGWVLLLPMTLVGTWALFAWYRCCCVHCRVWKLTTLACQIFLFYSLQHPLAIILLSLSFDFNSSKLTSGCWFHNKTRKCLLFSTCVHFPLWGNYQKEGNISHIHWRRKVGRKYWTLEVWRISDIDFIWGKGTLPSVPILSIVAPDLCCLYIKMWKVWKIYIYF